MWVIWTNHDLMMRPVSAESIPQSRGVNGLFCAMSEGGLGHASTMLSTDGLGWVCAEEWHYSLFFFVAVFLALVTAFFLVAAFFADTVFFLADAFLPFFNLAFLFAFGFVAVGGGVPKSAKGSKNVAPSAATVGSWAKLMDSSSWSCGRTAKVISTRSKVTVSK